MEADRADFRSLRADHDVTAVAAFPDRDAGLLKHLLLFHVLQQLAIALFVGLFNRSHAAELSGEFRETFFIGFLRHTVIHIRPLVIFTGSGSGEVFLGRADLAELTEPQLRVFTLVISGLLEKSGNLFVTRLLRDACEERVLVAGLGLTGKGFPQILFGLRTGITISSQYFLLDIRNDPVCHPG